MGDAGAIVDGVLAEHPLAGISLGVVTRDGLGETVLRGIATDDRAVTLDTVFRIGSVTKTMTALALLRQWEAGRFDLDDPVNDHLSGLELVGRPGWRAPTIRQLLTHTAGIGELAAWSDLRRPMIGLACPPGEPARNAAERYGGRLHLDVEPGTKWAYANHGFNVLGYLVEQMSGEPYGEHMRSVLFDPLGMDHTDVERSERVRDALATGLRQPAARSALTAGHRRRDATRGFGLLDPARHGGVRGRAARRRAGHREARDAHDGVRAALSAVRDPSGHRIVVLP